MLIWWVCFVVGWAAAQQCADLCGSNNNCATSPCPRCDLLRGQCEKGYGCGCSCDVDSDCDQTANCGKCYPLANSTVGLCGVKYTCGGGCNTDADCDAPLPEPQYSCSKCELTSRKCLPPFVPSPCDQTSYTAIPQIQIMEDYIHFEGLPTLDSCLQKCCADLNCAAVTAVFANWGSLCYLHNHTDKRGQNKDTTIYLRQTRVVPSPPPPPTPSPPETCVAPYPGEPHKNCSALLDFMFLLDGSGSISPPDWVEIKRFTMQIGLNFTTAPALMQYGIVQFSDVAKLFLPMTPNNSSFQMAMSTMRQFQQSTNTGAGLQTVAKEFADHGRSGAYRVVIIMTDGLWNAGPDPIAIAEQMKAEGSHIYCVAIGGFDISRVQALASDPKEHYYFNVSTEAELPVVLHHIINNICWRDTTPVILPRRSKMAVTP